jgi:hypothetical protein
MSNLQELQQLAEKRRSIYALSNQLPVSNDDVVKLVAHAISVQFTVSSYCCVVW